MTEQSKSTVATPNDICDVPCPRKPSTSLKFLISRCLYHVVARTLRNDEVRITIAYTVLE